MAKKANRKTQWRRRVIDTGIYQEVVYDSRDGAEGEPCDGREVVRGNLTDCFKMRFRSITTQIEQRQKELDGHDIDTQQAELWDARNALNAVVDWLNRQTVGQQERTSPVRCVTAADAIYNAMELGALVERLHVRRFESAARSGRASREGAKDGGRARKIPDEVKAEKGREYLAMVDERMNQNRHLSYTEATERVATAKGISGRTVRSYIDATGLRTKRKK